MFTAAGWSHYKAYFHKGLLFQVHIVPWVGGSMTTSWRSVTHIYLVDDGRFVSRFEIWGDNWRGYLPLSLYSKNITKVDKHVLPVTVYWKSWGRQKSVITRKSLKCSSHNQRAGDVKFVSYLEHQLTRVLCVRPNANNETFNSHHLRLLEQRNITEQRIQTA